MTDALADLIAALALPGQPDTLFSALDAACARLAGHRLFTLLTVDGDEVARVYSSRPEAYPVSGRKAMGPTPWGAHVLAGRKPFVGRDLAAIRWAFYDAALIESLGLGSVVNIPVLYDGRTIGTMNLLHAEFHFDDGHVAPLRRLAPALVPAFLTHRLAARPA